MTIEDLVIFTQAIAWYQYNVPNEEIIKETYGEDISEGYFKEKLEFLERKNILALFCELDMGHRENMIKKICDRYEIRVK